MGAAEKLIGVPAPFQLVARNEPRRCSVCGEEKMEGRAPNATKCLDCASGRSTLRDRKRAYATKRAFRYAP